MLTIEPFLVDAGDRRNGMGLVSDTQRTAWFRVPSHRTRGPHPPRERLWRTEIGVGTIESERGLGMTWVEEGEVVPISEGCALCGRLVWLASSSVACREGDVEVGEMGRCEGVSERE